MIIISKTHRFIYDFTDNIIENADLSSFLLHRKEVSPRSLIIRVNNTTILYIENLFSVRTVCKCLSMS